MTYEELRSALRVTSGTVSIDRGALGDEIDALLASAYLDQSVVIHEAASGPGDGQDGKVVIVGRAAFLTTPYPLGLPVQATFTLDTDGVHALIRYTLVGDLMPSGAWVFSQSFPGLPGVLNLARLRPDGSIVSPLDALVFNDASFLVTSRACTETGYGVALDRGLNFAGRARPSDLMGVFEQVLFGASNTLVLSGPIFVPVPTIKLPPRAPLKPERFPWGEDVVTPVPGIMLRAVLDAKPLKLGDALSMQATEFRIYSPLSYEWFDQNTTYLPVSALLATVEIPSAAITVALTAETLPGAEGATLIGEFTGVKLGKLAGLLDFAGTGTLIDDMPDPLKKIGDALGDLELESAKIELSAESGGLAVLATSARIGMPDQVWRLWPGTDSLDVGAVYAVFDVASPFGQPKIDVTVGGTISIEGVPIELRARGGDGFTAYAELGEAETIPLNALMKTYIPTVPAPSDLTIDAMSVIVAPGKYYIFTAALAQQPSPWVISLGPKDLTISDVSMLLTYPSGGPASGSFAGTIALGTIATVSIIYDVPGALVLRGNLPRIGLSDLAREIADATDLPFPSDFPEIDLVDSFVQFTRDASPSPPVYSFILRTTVSIGSTPGFNLMATVVKSGAATGFAAALWTPKWAPGAGWTPGSLWKPLDALTIDSAGLIVSTITPDPVQQRAMIPIDQVPALQQDKFKIVAGVSFFASLRLDAGSIAVLKQIFGDDTVFSLFAALGTDKSTVLIAHLSSNYSKGVFTFNGFDLAWDSTGTSIATISATARGSFDIDGNRLSMAVTGAVSTDGSARIAFAIVNWVAPFGYERLTVKRFAIAIALAEGVTITLDGTFDFDTGDKRFLFAVAGAITDFEAPSALAFALQSEPTTPEPGVQYGRMLKISEVIEGITTIDIYNLPSEANAVPWITEIKLLDLFLEIQELRFWVVLADQVTIDTTLYRKGFGFRGDIALFGKPIQLYVDVQQANARFAGSAEFPDAITLGNVLALGRPTTISIDSRAGASVGPDSTSSPQGPALQVSSYIDAQHQYYLFVAAHVVFLDVLKLDILGKASNDGITFSSLIEAGTSGSGAWGAQQIDVLVSREKLACSAGLAYSFGMKNVSLGGFELFDTLSIPTIKIPDFAINITGTIAARILPPKFSLGGSLKFSFMDIDFDESFSIDIDLEKAPGQIADIGAFVLDWIKGHLKALLSAALDTAKKFADWVKGNFETFKDDVEAVAHVFKDEFDDLGRDAVKGLMTGIGYAGSAIDTALDDVFGAIRKACAATQATLALA